MKGLPRRPRFTRFNDVQGEIPRDKGCAPMIMNLWIPMMMVMIATLCLCPERSSELRVILAVNSTMSHHLKVKLSVFGTEKTFKPHLLKVDNERQESLKNLPKEKTNENRRFHITNFRLT